MPGPNVPYTNLDYEQVIKQVYDEVNDRLRVDAIATIITPPALEVSINQVDDNIAIGNGTTLFTGTAQPGSKFSLDVSAYQAGTWSITTTLPTGAATEAKQDVGNASLASIDSKLTGPIPVSQSGAWSVGRTWTLSSGTDSISAVQSGTWNINNISGTISLPTGASTSALQTTGNASLASIDSKLTSPITITGALTDAQLRATPVPISGTVTTTQGTSPWIISGTVAATQSGAWTTGRTWTLVSGTDSVSSVQSGSWSVAVNNAAGAAAVNIQDGGNSITVDGTVTVTQGTSPWVVSGTVTTTSSNDTNYGTVGANTLRTAAQIGNATGAALFGAGTTTAQVLRVVLPTDQTAIPATQSGAWAVAATQSGTWNINNISGTISLPTGAATSTNLSDGTQKTQIVDGSGTVIGPSQTISGTNYMPVVLAASATSGSAVVARSIQIAGSDGTNARTLSTDTTGKLNINNISGTVSLPTGAATETTLASLQNKPNTSYVTTNTTVTTTATKIPATNLANRKYIVIYNQTGAIMYYGPSGVTTSTGIALANGGIVSFLAGPAIDFYGILASGSGTATSQELA